MANSCESDVQIGRVHAFSRKIRDRLRINAASEIDQNDVALMHDVLTMRFALLLDLLAGSTQSEYSDSWERTLLSLRTLEVELYASDWKTCREIYTSVAFNSVEDDACAACFKHMSQGRIHYKWILGSVLALIGGTDWRRKLNQWIVFDSKVNLRSLDLTTACCTEYIDFELRHIAETWENLSLVQRCAKDMFGDFVITDYPFHPRHGNGATAEVYRRDADSWHKNRHFAVDGEVINYLRYRLAESEWKSSLYLPYRGLDRRSILVCVPKSMTKNRTISKEPTTLQFLQQDIYHALDRYFQSHLSHCINLHDQERSRFLALQGSADGSYATIDLSSASDSVSVSHIEAIFDGLPVLYPLMATRSTTVHVADKSGTINEDIVTKKFAPMGSATCFPTECMVFATLCEAAVRLETGRRSRKYDYVVYGDDIVIKSSYGTRLISLLDEFGFIVNSDKSFLDSDLQHHLFREACGIEALDGEDITPLRLSRRLVSLTKNDSDRQAGQGVGMVDLINRAFLYGFTTLRRWINDVLGEHYWYRRLLRVSRSNYESFVADISAKKIPWLDVAMPFVITEDLCDTQWKAYSRRSIFDCPTHRVVARVLTAKTRPSAQHHDSNDYYTWLCRAGDEPSEEVFVLDATGNVTIRPHDLKWVKTWVPLPYGTPHYLKLRPL